MIEGQENSGARRVEDYLNEVDYSHGQEYVPSEFALEFVNFLKLVNGGQGEENTTPEVHYRMLDTVVSSNRHVANMCSRGLSKTGIFGEYLFLYLAVFGKLPEFGKINYALYVGDSIENGVKKMRLRLERRYENSSFLKHYVPEVRFTDIRWYFKNKAGNEFVVTGHGASTGVRGTVELNTRPQLAILDDLLSDADAKSASVIENIENTVYKAIDYALHPARNKIIWSGTPFNARDPLYKAVESGAWSVNVFPICEEFPVEKKDFRGAWEDRFTYEHVKDKYEKAVMAGKVHTFNQELMLRIMSEEDRLIEDADIVWYKRSQVLSNKGAYNFYITTDFATSERKSSDYSVISVWAYSNNGDWLWVDGLVKRQLMNANIDALFDYVVEYRPQSVGIEVTGQQAGFISWIQNEMVNRNCYFTLASDKNSNKLGIRPNTNKMERFNVVLPWFKTHKIWFPEEMKQTEALREAMEELRLVSAGGMKSKHDDFLDTISMLGSLRAWKPSQVTVAPGGDKDDWEEELDNKILDRYIV